MSRTKDSRRYGGAMGTGLGDLLAKVFTKENIQTGVQIAQQATQKAGTGGTISYNGTDAQISGPQSYLNYVVIGGIGLAALYLLKHKK
jgi:hypothetical protein